MNKTILINKVQEASHWRWHKLDPYRGYKVPPYALAGTSYTGDSSDSPYPFEKIQPELDKLITYLNKNGLHPGLKHTESSNVFMIKIWIVVPNDEYQKARELVDNWLNENNSLHYLHNVGDGDEIEIDKETEVEEPKLAQTMIAKHTHISLPLLQKAPPIIIPSNNTPNKEIIKSDESITKKHHIRLEHKNRQRLRA